MAIYIKAKKDTETLEYLIYQYGTDADKLDCQLKLFKEDYKVRRIEGSVELSPDIITMMIASKILGYFKANNAYPDEICKEA